MLLSKKKVTKQYTMYDSICFTCVEMEDIHQNTKCDFLWVVENIFQVLYFLILWESSIIKMHYNYSHKTIFYYSV